MPTSQFSNSDRSDSLYSMLSGLFSINDENAYATNIPKAEINFNKSLEDKSTLYTSPISEKPNSIIGYYTKDNKFKIIQGDILRLGESIKLESLNWINKQVHSNISFIIF